jgi:hypothetical protein
MESRRYAVGEDLARRWDWKFGIRRGGRAFRDGESDPVENQLRQGGCRGFRELDTLKVRGEASFRGGMAAHKKINDVPPPNFVV